MNDEKEQLHEGLRSVDIFEATDRAKVKSTQLLEEQDLTAISLALSKVNVSWVLSKPYSLRPWSNSIVKEQSILQLSNLETQ